MPSNFIVSFIKDTDMFSKNIDLNFNKKQSHGTLLGGMFSVFIRTLIMYMTTTYFIKLVMYTGDNNSVTTNMLDPTTELINHVGYNTTDYIPTLGIIEFSKYRGMKYDE